MFTKKQLELIEQPLVGIIAIPNLNNYPHMTPVWVVHYNNKIYFSTTTERAKYNHLLLTKKVGMSIIHPSGGSYVSFYADAKVRKQHEFEDYRVVLKKIISNYVAEENQEKFENTLVSDKTRILIELDSIICYPS